MSLYSLKAKKVAERLATVEQIRSTWKGDPGYQQTLDIDIYALRVLLLILTNLEGGPSTTTTGVE